MELSEELKQELKNIEIDFEKDLNEINVQEIIDTKKSKHFQSPIRKNTIGDLLNKCSNNKKGQKVRKHQKRYWKNLQGNKKWNKDETEKFYKALSKYGSDFSMIAEHLKT